MNYVSERLEIQFRSAIFHNQGNIGSIKTQCAFTSYDKSLKKW